MKYVFITERRIDIFWNNMYMYFFTIHLSNPAKQSHMEGDKITFQLLNSRYLEVVATNFYKFKLPEVQINLHFG